MPKNFKEQQNLSLRKQRALAENSEIDRLLAAYKSLDSKTCHSFPDFPFSSKTLRGLTEAKYRQPTQIQRESIPFALKGCDILGAAKTGSGKTLAFVIPALERLFTKSWSHYDGCGVLIITPTRELAAQIFEVFRIVGKYHTFSAGVVIGGKSLKQESEQIRTTNIIICTPGRLRQHTEETYNFELTNLQMLILDEADRMLDMGFQRDMDAIIENLSPDRQTLLFSATQTKSLNELARLSLQNPVFVSAHELSEHSTPDDLRQNYLICEQNDKLNILFSFIKTHLQQKTLVFVSTCKQVKFIYAVFCKLRPGTSVMALHGDMNQMKRIGVYEDFTRKQRGILLSTDVAARGLDFPGINWVVQLDCPDTAESYIHRVGRTARFEKGGQALLFLLPSEKGMLTALEKRRVPVAGIKTNPKQVWSIDAKLQALCASDLPMKERAQRAFVAYIRSVFLMSDKSVFNIEAIDLEKFARSLGLAAAPIVSFTNSHSKSVSKKHDAQTANSKSKKLESLKTDTDDEDILIPVTSTSDDKLSTAEEVVELPTKSKNKAISKYTEAKKSLSLKLKSNKRIVFLEDEKRLEEPANDEHSHAEPNSTDNTFSFDAALRRMAKVDDVDKNEWRQRIKTEHRRKRLLERQRQREMKNQSSSVTLGNINDNSEGNEQMDSGSDSYSDNDASEPAYEESDQDIDNQSDRSRSDSNSDNSESDNSEDHEDDVPNRSAKKARRDFNIVDDEKLALQLLSGK